VSEFAVVDRGRNLRALTARIAHLESERAEARDQARLLRALHDSFARIAAAATPEDAIAQMLQAARDPLAFSRAIYFSVSREHGVEARFRIDGAGRVETSRLRPRTARGSAVLRLLRGGARATVGHARDRCAPLEDGRGWYVLGALGSAERTTAILYADGHRSPTPLPWAPHLIASLATFGALSIEKAVCLQRTRELALRDPLTGLLNRRAFSERLQGEIEAARRRGTSLAYVILDVDDFKSVNDTHGHARGDAMLERLAATLERSSRAQDLVGRYAGDEFVLVFVDVEPPQARALVERLSLQLRDAELSCSIGAATFPFDGADAPALLAAADAALYAAKARGKDGFAFAGDR